jgi:putative transposase
MANSYHAVYEHIVFSTKNRQPWLMADLRPDLFAYLAGAIKNQSCHPLLVGGFENHVHILLRRHATVLTPDLVKEIKRTSSQWLSGMGVARGRFHWQAGYGAFSVSYWDLEKIKRYVADQAEHHRKMSWEDEYRKLLIKHGVEFDERYFLD